MGGDGEQQVNDDHFHSHVPFPFFAALRSGEGAGEMRKPFGGEEGGSEDGRVCLVHEYLLEKRQYPVRKYELVYSKSNE